MTTLFPDILARGEPAIDEIIQERREEGLHLEFKTLSESSGLNRDDRKMIAKAISRFCNAEGGLLIIGIETKRTDGVDIAVAPKRVGDLDRFRSLVTSALPEMLSPQHSRIRVDAIRCSADSTRYILVNIPASNDRPHMSLSDQRYYRRGARASWFTERSKT